MAKIQKNKAKESDLIAETEFLINEMDIFNIEIEDVASFFDAFPSFFCNIA